MSDEDIRKAEEAIERAEHDLEEARAALHMNEAAAQPVQPAAAPQPAPTPAPVTQPASQPAPAAPVTPSPAAPQPTAPATPPRAAPAAPASSGSKWRVEYERDNCIGAGACVAANSEYWSIDEDGKATLKSATFDQGKNLWILELDEGPLLQKQRDAAGVCPVNVIHIISPDGKKEF